MASFPARRHHADLAARRREIFYLSPDHHTLFAADVIARGDDFQVTKVQTLFTKQAVAGVGYPYDVVS